MSKMLNYTAIGVAVARIVRHGEPLGLPEGTTLAHASDLIARRAQQDDTVALSRAKSLFEIQRDAAESAISANLELLGLVEPATRQCPTAATELPTLADDDEVCFPGDGKLAVIHAKRYYQLRGFEEDLMNSSAATRQNERTCVGSSRDDAEFCHLLTALRRACFAPIVNMAKAITGAQDAIFAHIDARSVSPDYATLKAIAMTNMGEDARKAVNDWIEAQPSPTTSGEHPTGGER